VELHPPDPIAFMESIHETLPIDDDRLTTHFHGATIWCAEAASALTAAAICRLIATLTLPSQSEAISPQAECADPGIRLTVLYRKAETGKRLMGSAQAIGILADVPVTRLRRNQIMACDVAGGSA
jgi:hypothetical protein